MIRDKLENIISGHKINEDDADWLRGIAQQLLDTQQDLREAKKETDTVRSDAAWANDFHNQAARDNFGNEWK